MTQPARFAVRRGAEDRLWLGAVALLAALLAVWIDLSSIHRYHNGDSVIPILVSLERWTPFFWEQNRFGMLLPLLALPIRKPLHNLLFQVGLRWLALVVAYFLLARVAVPRRYWPAAGGAALGLLLATRSLPHLTYLHEQPYYQSIALALGGVLLLDREGWARRIAGSLLMALAFWVSPATLFWLVPLLGLRRLLGLAAGPSPPAPLPAPPAPPPGEGRQEEAARNLILSCFSPLSRGREGGAGRGAGGEGLLLAGACFLASLAASRLYSLHAYGWTTMRPVQMADWPLGWRRLAEEAVHYLSPGWVITVGLLLAVAAAFSLAGRQWGRLAFAAGLCLLAAAAGELAALGTSGWIHSQRFDVRYLLSGLTATAVAGPALLITMLLEKAPAGWQRTVNALVLLALLPIAWLRFGPPSSVRARAALDAGLGRHSTAVLASGSTHVIGNFWRVWPAVFHANLVLSERGDARRVWAVTYRSAPTRSLWTPVDWRQARFTVLGAEEETERYRRIYGIPPLYRKAYLGRVEIATVTPPAIPKLTFLLPPQAPYPAPVSTPPLELYPLRPCRLLDTLWSEPLVSGAPPQRIEMAGADCGVPRGAQAVAVTIQAVLPPSDGWITLWPADRSLPSASTLSFRAANAIIARPAILPLSAEPRGALAMAATLEDGGDVRVFLDVTGYYRPRTEAR